MSSTGRSDAEQRLGELAEERKRIDDELEFYKKDPSKAPDSIRRKVEDAADTLELTEHLQRKPANLSGGQRQRVAMGRAIVREPSRVSPAG